MVCDPLQRISKALLHNSKPESKMLRHLKTIARREEGSSLSHSATEHSRIAATLEPGETDHPAAGTYPAEFVFPLSKKLIEELKIGGDNFARARENQIALTQCNLR